MTSRLSASLGRLSLAVTLGLTGACTAETGEDLSVESDELRSLTTAEVVGTISANQTVRVNYEPIPRYRALSFSGAAGDNITIAVHGLGKADAIAFLLSDSYRTLDRNDNASESNRDSLITRKLTKTGTYYVAVREVDEETSPSSAFDITLTKTSTPTPATSDPFDPASCTGPTLSSKALVAKIPAGESSKNIPAETTFRLRECTKFGGCSSWQTVDGAFDVKLYSFGDVQEHRATGSLRLVLPDDALAPEAGISFTYYLWEVSSTRTYTSVGKNEVTFLGRDVNVDLFTYRPAMSKGATFDLTLRDTCFRAVSKHSTEQPHLQNYIEVESVLHGRY